MDHWRSFFGSTKSLGNLDTLIFNEFTMILLNRGSQGQPLELWCYRKQTVLTRKVLLGEEMLLLLEYEGGLGNIDGSLSHRRVHTLGWRHCNLVSIHLLKMEKKNKTQWVTSMSKARSNLSGGIVQGLKFILIGSQRTVLTSIHFLLRIIQVMSSKWLLRLLW